MKNYGTNNNINHNTMMNIDPNIRIRHTLGSMMLECDQDDSSNRNSDAATSPSVHQPPSDHSSPMWDHSPRWSLASTPLSMDINPSPLSKSPWLSVMGPAPSWDTYSGLIGSLVREEGHVYSLAASGELLYTGSDSRNIRVWKNQKEFSGFKSSSGLVKAIIIAGERIFTGHQDGKIRVWKISAKNYVHKRIGTLPTLKAKFKSSLKPSNYVEVRKKRNAIWIKHVDAISSLCLSEDKSILYSASWDKMVKVWRISDFKCLESINAHEDAVNSVVTGFDGLVFTGSADGCVKVWRKEMQGNKVKHILVQILLKQEWAITSLAVESSGSVLYCGSSDGLVNFWERHKFLSHGGVLRGHKLAVLCLATAGNLVLSGSADMNICLWKRDHRDGEHICLSVLCGHLGPVKCLAVEEEDEAYPHGVDRPFIIYSGSLDKSVKIWRVLGQTVGTQTSPGLPEKPLDNYIPRHKFSSSYRQGTPPRTPENYNGLQKLHVSQSTRTATQGSSKMSRKNY